MWTATRRRAKERSKASRHYVIGSLLVLWALFVVFLLVQSFVELPAALQLSQRCRMSRMWPSYFPYNAPSPSGLSKKYRLFLYREAYPGRRKEEDEPRGRPALFIPGNAGSFGQVRSVASSAHHLHRSGQGGNGVSEVDWWTVDFNEDFSAFHGETMHEQAEYINEVLRFLLEMYPKAHQIPILAHSMGGIVARLMMLKDGHPKGSVDTIITLSSPHAYPPVPLDGGVEEVYRQINANWEETAQDTLLISLSGGILDNQLSSEPSSLPLARLWHRNSSISAFTSSLPALWSGVDHLAMMWCDQLRERIARGVLRIEGQQKPLKERREGWRRILGIEEDGQVVHLSDDRLSPPGVNEGHTVSTFSIVEAGAQHDAFELITDLSVGLDTSFGPPIEQEASIRVDVCFRSTKEGIICQHVLPSAYDLYPPSPRLVLESQAFPSYPVAEERYEVPGHSLRRLQISMDQLKSQNIDHIRVERKVSAGFLVAGWTAPAVVLKVSLSIVGSIRVPLDTNVHSSSPSRSIFVTEMDSSLLAYDLTVIASKHVDPSCHYETAPMLKAQSLSTGDTQYYPSIRPGSKLPLTLHSTSPFMPPATESRRGTKFTLLLDACSQVSAVSVSINWKASMGLLLSRYRTALGSLPLAVLLLLMSVIWDEWEQGAPFPSLTTATIQYAPVLAPTLVLLSVSLSILQHIAALWTSSSGGLLSPSLQDVTFGLAHFPVLTNAFLGFLFLTSAYGLCLLVSILLQSMVNLITSLARLAGLKSGFEAAEEGSVEILRRPISTMIGFVVLALTVWLAIPIQFVFLVLFLIQLYSAVQSTIAARNSEGGDDTSRANQQALLLNLYFWLLPSNAPALLIWTRNLVRGYYGVLGGADHNILPAVGFLAISQISSSGDILRRSRHRLICMITKGLLAAFSLLSIAYGIRYTYILFRYANILTAWLALGHFLEKRQAKETVAALSDEDESEVRESLKMPVDLHSTVPDSIGEVNVLPDGLIASLKRDTADGYDLKGDNEATIVGKSQMQSRNALLERYLDLLDEYFARKKQISDDISNGHFQLSKARMQLGRLTSMNEGWDARMRTTWAVRVRDDGQMTLESTKPSFDKEDEEVEAVLIEEKGQSSLRRRKRAEPHESPIEDTSEKSTKKEGEAKKKGQPFNPLYQFAALPPPSLRQAQSSFSAVLHHLVDETGGKSLLQIQKELKSLEQMIDEKK